MPETEQHLSSGEYFYIEIAASLRREKQRLETALSDLVLPKGLPEYVAKLEYFLTLAKEELNGDPSLTAYNYKKDEYLAEDWPEKARKFEQSAIEWVEIAPNMSQFLYAELAKAAQLRGEAVLPLLAQAVEMRRLARQKKIAQNSPNAFLADAMMVGVQKRALLAAKQPSWQQVGAAVASHAFPTQTKLVAQYALVLAESDRESFLHSLPEAIQDQVALELDLNVAETLHHAYVSPKSPEEEQRKAVRNRLFSKLRELLTAAERSEQSVIKRVAETIGAMGEDSKQLLLEAVREQELSGKVGHIPRVLKVLVDHFDDFRSNDLALQLAADRSISPHLARYLLRKLVVREYLDPKVGEWLEETDSPKTAAQKLAVVQAVVTDLGVMPSLEICEFITDDANWRMKEFSELNESPLLETRIEIVKNSQSEFVEYADHLSLIHFLAQDKHKAMIFYLLNGGKDRFRLINNYSFQMFSSMLDTIHELTINHQPLNWFQDGLRSAGMPEAEIQTITSRLLAGKFPFSNETQGYKLVNFEVSGNAVVQNANQELGAILGKNQLGVVLLFPLYREFLTDDNEHQFDAELATATTFSARAQLIDAIEITFPAFKNRAREILQKRWQQFGEKMFLEVSIDDVLNSHQIMVQGEHILPKLDTKRIDLRQANQELLVALRGENKQILSLRREVKAKQKSLAGLQAGLERQTDANKQAELSAKVAEIERDIQSLEQQLLSLGTTFVSDARFSNLTEAEKKVEIDRLGKELVALAEKSASAIFTYLVMQVLGKKEWVEQDQTGKEVYKDHDRLTEDDINLIKEMESHLQAPFQQISDATTYYQKPGSEEKKRKEVALHWVDKRDRLMNIVRFADSKICCFSSSNYKMTVAFRTPNEYWVASIVADPLSFVLSIELPTDSQTNQDVKQGVVQNEGFIFGSFGLDENNKPVILLNGIYYAPGVENEQQVDVFLQAVEQIFAGFPLHGIAIATQHGGLVKLGNGWTRESAAWKRLRAIDDGRGKPESHIYDDLGTAQELNQPHEYEGSVWHKKLEASDTN